MQLHFVNLISGTFCILLSTERFSPLLLLLIDKLNDFNELRARFDRFEAMIHCDNRYIMILRRDRRNWRRFLTNFCNYLIVDASINSCCSNMRRTGNYNCIILQLLPPSRSFVLFSARLANFKSKQIGNYVNCRRANFLHPAFVLPSKHNRNKAQIHSRDRSIHKAMHVVHMASGVNKFKRLCAHVQAEGEKRVSLSSPLSLDEILGDVMSFHEHLLPLIVAKHSFFNTSREPWTKQMPKIKFSSWGQMI